PNVESLLRQIRGVGFASGQTQAKPIKVAVINFHKILKLHVGGHDAVIQKWEFSNGSLFPLKSKDLPHNAREDPSNFSRHGNNSDPDASDGKRSDESKPNLSVRSGNFYCCTNCRSVAFACNSDKS